MPRDTCAAPTLCPPHPQTAQIGTSPIDLGKGGVRFSGFARKRRISLREAKNPLLRFLWPFRHSSLSEEQFTQCSMAYRALRTRTHGDRMSSSLLGQIELSSFGEGADVGQTKHHNAAQPKQHDGSGWRVSSTIFARSSIRKKSLANREKKSSKLSNTHSGTRAKNVNPRSFDPSFRRHRLRRTERIRRNLPTCFSSQYHHIAHDDQPSFFSACEIVNQ
jgi:hypothetical protein